MKKIQIHQFEQPIYPYNLWVCISGELTPIKERFLNDEGKEIEGDIKNFRAVTINAITKEDPHDNGVIIVFKHKKYLTTSVVAHESYHASQSFWEHIGETYPSEEATAYLIGWIAECCDKVKTGRD